MTRINTISPSRLKNKHLLAEYRELPRIFKLSRKAQLRGEKATDPRNPKQYCMGTGHVRFFYDKLRFLVNRQKLIIAELQKRGYTIQYTEVDHYLDSQHPEFCNDWAPTPTDDLINIKRLKERGGLLDD